MMLRVGMLAAVLCLAVVPSSMGAPRAHKASQRCGAIRVAGATVVITTRGPVNCFTARDVMRRLFSNQGTKHGGPSSAQTTYTVGRWSCGFGAGAAGCRRGRADIFATAR